MTTAIDNLVTDVVASINQGQSLKVSPALKALPEADLLKLATEGLSGLVNIRMRQIPEPDDFADMAEDFDVYTDAEIAELAEQAKAA